AIFDVAILGHEHGKGPALPEIDELDLLELLALLLDQHHSGAARKARQQLASLAEQLFERTAPTAADDPAFDLAAFLVADVADLEQPVDEEAQARMGRQSPRARVRRVDEAETFKVRHDVAYRGWRQRHRQRPAQVARADRLAGGKVSLDDPLEDLARTLVQLAQSGRRFRCGLGFIDVRMAHC